MKIDVPPLTKAQAEKNRQRWPGKLTTSPMMTSVQVWPGEYSGAGDRWFDALGSLAQAGFRQRWRTDIPNNQWQTEGPRVQYDSTQDGIWVGNSQGSCWMGSYCNVAGTAAFVLPFSYLSTDSGLGVSFNLKYPKRVMQWSPTNWGYAGSAATIRVWLLDADRKPIYSTYNSTVDGTPWLLTTGPMMYYADTSTWNEATDFVPGRVPTPEDDGQWNLAGYVVNLGGFMAGVRTGQSPAYIGVAIDGREYTDYGFWVQNVSTLVYSQGGWNSTPPVPDALTDQVTGTFKPRTPPAGASSVGVGRLGGPGGPVPAMPQGTAGDMICQGDIGLLIRDDTPGTTIFYKMVCPAPAANVHLELHVWRRDAYDPPGTPFTEASELEAANDCPATPYCYVQRQLEFGPGGALGHSQMFRFTWMSGPAVDDVVLVKEYTWAFNSAGRPYPKFLNPAVAGLTPVVLAAPMESVLKFPEADYLPGHYTNNSATRTPNRQARFTAECISMYDQNHWPWFTYELDGTFTKFEGHHWRPLEWGGGWELSNCVMLRPRDHDRATAWWLYFPEFFVSG